MILLDDLFECQKWQKYKKNLFRKAPVSNLLADVSIKKSAAVWQHRTEIRRTV